MGVSGSGKTTTGVAVGHALSLPFLEADELHSAHNIEKMQSGQPLTDEDRAPWLHTLAQALQDSSRYPLGLVLTCSALKRAYRDRLRRAGSVRFVFLDVPEPEAERRLRVRAHHFMPASLVPSQFAALERPALDEGDTVTIRAAAPVDAVVAATLAALQSFNIS